MLTGTPVVSIKASGWHAPAELFEGDEIVPTDWPIGHLADSDLARTQLRTLLDYPYLAAEKGHACRERAIELFDVAEIGQQWADFLGSPKRMDRPVARLAQPVDVELGVAGIASGMVADRRADGAT